MATKFRSIKEKLRLYFGVYLFLNALVIGVIFMFYEKRERIEQITDLLSELHIQIQTISALEKDFFTYETINTSFYEDGKSTYLQEHKQQLFLVRRNLKVLKQRKELLNETIDKKLFQLTTLIGEYEVFFERLVELIQCRGFKDFGKEGQMRRFIHEIENSTLPFDREKVLMIRRHEKDFIIRKEEAYINKLSAAVQTLRKDIRTHVHNHTQQMQMLNLLRNYHYAFLEVVDYERQIGLTIHTGMRHQVQQKAYHIADVILAINKEAQKQAEEITFGIKSTLAVLVVLCFVLGIFVSYLISKKLSLPLRVLSQSIYAGIQNDFAEGYQIANIKSDDEIGWLSKDFNKMYDRIQVLLKETREKNTEIAKLQEQIMDSVRYAQQIQHAVLPTTAEFNQFFAESFVVYRPQKVVSGDFYWIFRKKQKTFIAVVDCTGHDVPGAFMSMIGYTLLNKIIGQNKIYDPAMILEVLHLEIQHVLKQQEGKNNDGMEVAICAIENDFEFKKVTFAGAHRPLYYTHQNRLKKIKGNKRSIGGRQKQEHQPFVTTTLYLHPQDTLYLTTDGFADQHNAARVKYGSNALVDFLETIKEESFDTQKMLLEKEFDGFKGNEPQRDDWTIVGVRL